MDHFLRLIIAAILGGAVGIERQVRGQYAGFRTQLLVCLGSCLFTIVSIQFFELYGKNTDPGRIAAQIITGIGFLGAGIILRYGGQVRGLTTAASLWVVSAIGMTVGFGEYILAGLATLVVLTSLIILKYIEDFIFQSQYVQLKIILKGIEELKIRELIKENEIGIKILEIKFKLLLVEDRIEQEITLQYKTYDQLMKLYDLLKKNPNLIELQII
jgi:putative Mg2+ transporter-C (MgtC) family protein